MEALLKKGSWFKHNAKSEKKSALLLQDFNKYKAARKKERFGKLLIKLAKIKGKIHKVIKKKYAKFYNMILPSSR